MGSFIKFSENYDLFITGIKIIVVLFSILSVTSNNPVISILYLIATFIAAAITFILSNFLFIGYILIMVYVGAIAILFVFIIMLFQVDIHVTDEDTKTFTYPMLFLLTMFPLILIIFNNASGEKYKYFLDNIFNINNMATYTNFVSNLNLFNKYNEIGSLGEFFFLTNPIYLFMIAMLLLIAMVGSIHITILK